MYADVGDAIALLKDLGFKIFLISNQAIVARGVLSFKEMLNLNNHILNFVIQQNPKAIFDDIFICPHHPNATLEAYRVDCECRKPKAGMLKDAAKKYNINFASSIVIGDRSTDIYAGKSVGCKGFQLLTGAQNEPLIESSLTYNQTWLIPDQSFKTLIEAAKYLRDQK